MNNIQFLALSFSVRKRRLTRFRSVQRKPLRTKGEKVSAQWVCAFFCVQSLVCKCCIQSIVCSCCVQYFVHKIPFEHVCLIDYLVCEAFSWRDVINNDHGRHVMLMMFHDDSIYLMDVFFVCLCCCCCLMVKWK